MNHFRRMSALLLSLSLMCTASSASAAAADTFSEVPVLQFKHVPSVGTESGDTSSIDINASIPGFLNMYLLDESGSIVLTIAKNQEIHSKVTTIDFRAADDDGNPLDPGTYTVKADMVSQYGVASESITKDTPVVPATEIDEDGFSVPVSSSSAASSAASSADSSAVSGNPWADSASGNPWADSASGNPWADIASGNSWIDNTSGNSWIDNTSGNPWADSAPVPAKTSAASATQTAAPRPAGASKTMQYEAGTFKMGDEGLMIGVGVGDTANQADAGYWALTADADDAAIWAALTRTLTGIEADETESAYIYDSTDDKRNKLGTVSGISQGVNVITKRSDGWSLVEAFRNEDGAFVRGYIRTNKLRTSEPNPTYGIVIDKATQTLTVYKEGTRLGSCKVSTGLPEPKYPHRETPAGEFILVTRRGSYEYYGTGYTKYTIRINGSYYLAEVPTTKKNGTKFLEMPDDLGAKATRGTVCIAHDASTDGGINAEWIWNMTDDNKKVKVLIFDDKPRTDVPVSTSK